MEGSDETGVMQRIQSSFGNCSSSSVPKQTNHHQQMGMSINGQMQNLSVDGSNKRPSGIPPSHPHSQFAIPKLGSQQQMGTQNFAIGPTHSRSLSQSSFFSFDHLPPLSPATFRDSPQSQSDLPMEDRASNSQGATNPTLFTAGGTTVHSNEGLPPRRGHRRSNSDVPLGFMNQSHSLPPQSKDNKPAQLILKKESDWGTGLSSNERKHDQGEVVEDLFSAYMNLDNIDALNSSSLEDKDMDSRASGTRTNESSENEVESGIHGGNSVSTIEKREKGKRSAPADIAPAPRHFRSLSMDSFMGSLNFSDESPRLPPSPGIRSAHHSPSNSFDGNSDKFSLEFGNGEFSAAEMKKIMASEKLAEMAMADPKRVKRILANRQSAARSKERKLRYIAELEHKVQTLQTEATTLSAQLTLLQRDSAGLTSQNNELRFRLQAMEQQAQLRDALNEALTAEVQRLKLATGELRAGEANMLTNPQMQTSQYNNMYQLNNEKQQQPSSQQNRTPQAEQSQPAQQDAKPPKT